MAAEEGATGEAGRSTQQTEFMNLAKESDPAYYRFLLGRDARDRLALEMEAQIRMRNTRIQTDACGRAFLPSTP